MAHHSVELSRRDCWIANESYRLVYEGQVTLERTINGQKIRQFNEQWTNTVERNLVAQIWSEQYSLLLNVQFQKISILLPQKGLLEFPHLLAFVGICECCLAFCRLQWLTSLSAVGACRCVLVCVPVVSGPFGSSLLLSGLQFWLLGSQSQQQAAVFSAAQACIALSLYYSSSSSALHYTYRQVFMCSLPFFPSQPSQRFFLFS